MTTETPANLEAPMKTHDPRHALLPPAQLQNWRLVVAYQGRGFTGWQAQEGQRSVQDELQKAIAKIAPKTPNVVVKAAGRTDAGVHARGQAVSTTILSRFTPDKLLLAMSSVLPWDVSVMRADIATPNFDARRHSIGKRYVYRIYNDNSRDPFLHNISWHVRGKLDVEAMRAAARHYVGEKDFESFRSTGCESTHARRYIWSVELKTTGPLIEIEVRGNAFCRHMVRILSGTLMDVGAGRFSPDDIPTIFAARDRTKAGITAPAEGLMLEDVYFPDNLDGAGIPEGAVFPGYPISDENPLHRGGWRGYTQENGASREDVEDVAQENLGDE